ncbi:Eno2 [Symbiodinium sp. CCMP2456]|nr:Eno2 [Symbiodinium sp. CCMP2456]
MTGQQTAALQDAAGASAELQQQVENLKAEAAQVPDLRSKLAEFEARQESASHEVERLTAEAAEVSALKAQIAEMEVQRAAAVQDAAGASLKTEAAQDERKFQMSASTKAFYPNQQSIEEKIRSAVKAAHQRAKQERGELAAPPRGHDQWVNPNAAWGSGYDQTGYSWAQAYHPAYTQAPAYDEFYAPSWNNQMGYAQGQHWQNCCATAEGASAACGGDCYNYYGGNYSGYGQAHWQNAAWGAYNEFYAPSWNNQMGYAQGQHWQNCCATAEGASAAYGGDCYNYYGGNCSGHDVPASCRCGRSQCHVEQNPAAVGALFVAVSRGLGGSSESNPNPALSAPSPDSELELGPEASNPPGEPFQAL